MTTSRSQKLNTVSRCMAARLFGIMAADHAGRRLVLEQLAGHLQHGLARGALAHADEDDALADRHHVAALDPRRSMKFSSESPNQILKSPPLNEGWNL